MLSAYLSEHGSMINGNALWCWATLGLPWADRPVSGSRRHPRLYAYKGGQRVAVGGQADYAVDAHVARRRERPPTGR